MKRMWVYIMTNKPYGTLYVGMTSELVERVYKHKTKFYPKSFTARYGLNLLVYYEECSDPENAIRREKQIKNWPRAKKLRLIESMNPDWRDLYPDLLG